MRCILHGWAFTVFIAPDLHGGKRFRASAVDNRASRPAFATPSFTVPGIVGASSSRGSVGNLACEGARRWAVGRLYGKKGQKRDVMDDFRDAAKVLGKMEKNRERKTQERARRRESNKPRNIRERQGDEQDDVLVLSKAAANPFKKERIVSKFDVNDIRKVEFVGSYEDDEASWPKTTLPEIAFLGRSNVGKSSMLNTLFGESVAKVSKTPGRTRQINIFKAKNSKGKDVCYFADLPGYGYAKMGKEQQRTIETFLEMYLERRANLKLLILLIDSRREPISSDAGILEYAEDKEDRPYKILIVATKVDKLNPMESILNIKRLQEAYDLPPGLPISSSAITGQGKKEIWSYIRQAAAAG